MTCKEIKEKLNLYLDRTLAEKEKKEVEKHLKKCRNCKCVIEELGEISSLLKEMPVPQARVDFSNLTFCPEIKSQLSPYLDGQLAFPEKETVEEHLRLCSYCRNELADLRSLKSLLKDIPVPAAGVDLPERIEKLLAKRRGLPVNEILRGLYETFRLPARRRISWDNLLPSLNRWVVFTGAAAGLIFLIIHFSTPGKKLPPVEVRLKSQTQESNSKKVAPSVVPVPKIAAKPEATAEKKEETKVASIPKEKIVPKVEITKPRILHLLSEVKPQVENILPTTLSREASFTTLSFLPTASAGLPAPQEQIYTSLYNGNHLWLGLFSSPAKIVKVDPQGNYAIYTCATGDDNATSMVYARGSLWVGLDSVPLKILKINPEDGSYKSYLIEETKFADGSGGVRNAATFDGKYLWFGLWTKPAKLVRINPEDLSYEIYTAQNGEDNPSYALYDGKNVWFGLYTAPGKYLKVNPADGTYVAYNLKEGENYIKTGVYDGQNVWFGLETNPGKLVKVNPFDGTYFAYNLRQGENIVTAGTFAQRYLWFSVASEPTKILQVNPYTGNYIAYTRGEVKSISSASFDGKNLWFPDKSGRLLKVSL